MPTTKKKKRLFKIRRKKEVEIVATGLMPAFGNDQCTGTAAMEKVANAAFGLPIIINHHTTNLFSANCKAYINFFDI